MWSCAQLPRAAPGWQHPGRRRHCHRGVLQRCHSSLNPPTPHPPPARSYINGKPFVVREAERPFSNLEYTGIDRERVEGMEARLKADVLAEAALYGSQVLVAHEDDQFQASEPGLGACLACEAQCFPFRPGWSAARPVCRERRQRSPPCQS